MKTIYDNGGNLIMKQTGQSGGDIYIFVTNICGQRAYKDYDPIIRLNYVNEAFPCLLVSDGVITRNW